jgi:hypothetical protein
MSVSATNGFAGDRRGRRRQRPRVRLAAETVTTGSRRIYRIHLDRFCEFLSAIGWQRLPARPDLVSNN